MAAEPGGEDLATQTPRNSARFPEGYGDFALQSSDAVVFHISKFLLAYTSPVFQDMFALGPAPEPPISTPRDEISNEESEKNDKNDSEPLKVTEDAHTLDQMLRHIDPKQPIAPLNELSIRALLEAARKYQLSVVTKWFESECMKHVEYPNNPTPGRSLMAHNPLLVLSLASEYDIPTLAQQATCALVTGDGELLGRDVDLPLKLYRHVSTMRDQRVKWYLDAIGTIAGKVHRGKPVQPMFCNYCGKTRGQWIHLLMEITYAAPNWKRFSDEVNSPTRKCRPGCGEWAAQVEEDMSVWAYDATIMEATLPSMPP